MAKIRAIIHDWDDTITNAFETYTQFYVDLGEHYKLGEVPIETIRKYWGGTIPQIVNGIWPHLSHEESEEYVNDFMKALQKWRKSYNAEVFPNVKETIEELHNKGYILGVITSGHRPTIEKIYEAQIAPKNKFHKFLFDHRDLGISKPKPEVFDMPMDVLKDLGIEEHETIYVGDSLQDYNAAKNRGIGFVAVTTGVKDRDDFLKEGLEEEKILDSFNELLNMY